MLMTTVSHLKSVFELTYYSFLKIFNFPSEQIKKVWFFLFLSDNINDWIRKRHSLQSNTRLNIFPRNSIHHIIMIEFPVPRKLTDYEILISQPLLYTSQRFFQYTIFTINNRITAQFTNHQTGTSSPFDEIITCVTTTFFSFKSSPSPNPLWVGLHVDATHVTRAH